MILACILLTSSLSPKDIYVHICHFLDTLHTFRRNCNNIAYHQTYLERWDLFIYLLVNFRATSGSTWILVMALHSGINPGSFRDFDPIGSPEPAEDVTQVSYMQGKFLNHCIIQKEVGGIWN